MFGPNSETPNGGLQCSSALEQGCGQQVNDEKFS